VPSARNKNEFQLGCFASSEVLVRSKVADVCVPSVSRPCDSPSRFSLVRVTGRPCWLRPSHSHANADWDGWPSLCPAVGVWRDLASASACDPRPPFRGTAGRSFRRRPGCFRPRVIVASRRVIDRCFRDASPEVFVPSAFSSHAALFERALPGIPGSRVAVVRTIPLRLLRLHVAPVFVRA